MFDSNFKVTFLGHPLTNYPLMGTGFIFSSLYIERDQVRTASVGHSDDTRHSTTVAHTHPGVIRHWWHNCGHHPGTWDQLVSVIGWSLNHFLFLGILFQLLVMLSVFCTIKVFALTTCYFLKKGMQSPSGYSLIVMCVM